MEPSTTNNPYKGRFIGKVISIINSHNKVLEFIPKILWYFGREDNVTIVPNDT